MTQSKSTHSKILPSPLPLVIQIGFAGARTLYDPNEFPRVNAQEFERAVADALTELLEKLPEELGLSDGHEFFCGISQIAIGADQAFAVACQRLGILHRIFLPQPLDVYLNATGSNGPDFSPEQTVKTQSLLETPTVIQTRVVSDTPNRRDRFTDTNLEIVRVSDIFICVIRAGQAGKQGGTHELDEMAERRGRPTIVLEVGVDAQNKPVIKRNNKRLNSFVRPCLPEAFTHGNIDPFSAVQLPPGELPTGKAFAEKLKNLGSDHANRLRFGFRNAALIIVVGHVLATILAVGALKSHHAIVTPVLLGLELLLLTAGLGVHYAIHHTESIRRWAGFRLIAEVARSIRAIGSAPVYLEYFFSLPFPPDFRPLLRTISVLHLKDNRQTGNADWKSNRDTYLQSRLTDPDFRRGQIAYQLKTNSESKSKITLARTVFYAASISALTSTLVKLLLICHCLPVSSEWESTLATAFGTLAIVLPVIAVASLSLAAAFDLEAKEHTSEEQLQFLEKQIPLLQQAQTQREFSRLLIETESRLLGETVNWYARRRFLGIA
ncbi:MAG: hypothetical protein Q8M16_23105 [Pirellulaceae bacterium]|nr:hypothetical protein [Pirellulaceae bacterium]